VIFDDPCTKFVCETEVLNILESNVALCMYLLQRHKTVKNGHTKFYVCKSADTLKSLQRLEKMEK
jgi:hypothetical protein